MAEAAEPRDGRPRQRGTRPGLLDLYLIHGVSGPFLLVTLGVGSAMMLERALRLIHELAAHSDRSASYACAAAFVSGAEEHVVIGRTTGHITVEPLGDEGFGYDPYFFSLELGKTFGQARVAEKEAVSQRGRAFRALFESLRDRPVG